MSDTVVTLGAHVLDILGRYVTHIPEGQGSVLLDEIRLAPAGSAAGTAVGLAKLGLEVATAGAVGDDALGDVLIRALNGFGVDTTHVVRKPGVQTSASILPIRPNGDRPALHAIGANAVYSIDDVPWKLIETAAHLHLGGNDSMRGLGRDGAAQILRRARDGGATTSMDILSEGSPKLLAILKPCLPLVDWFMPNADQACKLTDSHTPEDAASRLLDLGVGGVVLTMGGDGSLLATARERCASRCARYRSRRHLGMRRCVLRRFHPRAASRLAAVGMHEARQRRGRVGSARPGLRRRHPRFGRHRTLHARNTLAFQLTVLQKLKI